MRECIEGVPREQHGGGRETQRRHRAYENAVTSRFLLWA